VASAAERFGSTADALARTVTGSIRLSTNDAIADGLLAPAISRFRRLYPGVRVILDVSERLADLAAGEADIAVRGATLASTDAHVIQRRLPDSAWAIYCAPAYAKAAPPISIETIDAHPIASLGGAILESTMRQFPDARVCDVTNSTRSLIAVLQSGDCVGALPCFVGDRAGGLVRCLTLPDPAPLWLVYAERLRRRPEARALLDEIVRCLEDARSLLAGEGQTSGNT
jgi:DNA-binding transcriptional LysR family regulator